MTCDLSFSRLELLECLWGDEKPEYSEVDNVCLCIYIRLNLIATWLWLMNKACFSYHTFVLELSVTYLTGSIQGDPHHSQEDNMSNIFVK